MNKQGQHQTLHGGVGGWGKVFRENKLVRRGKSGDDVLAMRFFLRPAPNFFLNYMFI